MTTCCCCESVAASTRATTSPGHWPVTGCGWAESCRNPCQSAELRCSVVSRENCCNLPNAPWSSKTVKCDYASKVLLFCSSHSTQLYDCQTVFSWVLIVKLWSFTNHILKQFCKYNESYSVLKFNSKERIIIWIFELNKFGILLYCLCMAVHLQSCRCDNLSH